MSLPTPPASGAGSHAELTERDPWEELRAIEEEMKARGIGDVKFAWSPEARNKGSDELARDVVKFLRACLDGRTQPAPPVGDSHRAEPFEKTRGELAGWLYWEAESRSKDNHIRYRMLRRWEQWVKALAQVAPRVVLRSAPGRNEMLAFAAELCERVRDEYRRLQVGLAAEGAQACCDHIRLRIANSPPEEGRSLSKPHPSDVCGWCGFRFGKHSVVGDACPLPPASKEGSWTWDSRTFKPEVVPPKENKQ